MFVFALNRIQRPNPKNEQETEVISARTVFEATSEKFKELEELGAARKATNDEIDVYKANKARAEGRSFASDVTEATPTAEKASTDGGASNDGADAGKATTSTANAASAGTSSTTGKGQTGGKSSGSKSSSSEDLVG